MEKKLIPDSVYEAVISYFDNSLSDKQAEELIKWIGEDKRNLLLFHDLEIIWSSSSLLTEKSPDISRVWNSVLERIKDDDIRPMSPKKISITLSSLVKVAASLFIIISLSIGGYLLIHKSAAKISGNFFEAVAQRGSRSVITLPDGSTIWLNSGTRLKYSQDFGINTRDLKLEGEAYFSVTENKKVPFRVLTQELCITAVGTSFNVKAYPEEGIVETTLENGEVKIDQIQSKSDRSKPGPLTLKPNQKAVFVRGTSDLSRYNDDKTVPSNEKIRTPQASTTVIKVDSLVDTKLSTSWKDSKWIFKSERLKNMIPILERRYDVVISFRDTVLRNYKFTGIIMEEPLSKVLSALSMSAPIRFEIDRNSVILSEDQEKKSKYNLKPK